MPRNFENVTNDAYTPELNVPHFFFPLHVVGVDWYAFDSSIFNESLVYSLYIILCIELSLCSTLKRLNMYVCTNVCIGSPFREKKVLMKKTTLRSTKF